MAVVDCWDNIHICPKCSLMKCYTFVTHREASGLKVGRRLMRRLKKTWRLMEDDMTGMNIKENII